MKNERTSKIAPLVQTITLLVFILAMSFGCRPSEPRQNAASLALKARVQANIDLYIPELTARIGKKKRKEIRSILDNFYMHLNGTGDSSPFFLALLDSHGVTITSRTQTSVSGNQNYGNYRVVSNVLQKKRTFTSSLYLQGGGKVFIVCVPLMNSEKLTGIIIIGIDSEFLRQSGITESQFLFLDFNSQPNSTP